MEAKCIICHERLDATIGFVTTKCGHVFHHNCIDKWLDLSHACPECRGKISKNSLTKLFVNFDTAPDNNPEGSLDALKIKLYAMHLEIMDKDKKIKELQSYCAQSERDVEKMHQEQMELQNENNTLKREIRRLNQVDFKYQRVLEANNNLEGELEHLNNVKTIVEGCVSDAQKILAEVQVNMSSNEGKVATHRIATYCSVIKRELTRSKEEKAQLQNELTQVKCKMGVVQADSAKKVRQLVEKIGHLEEQIKNIQDSSSISVFCGPSPSSLLCNNSANSAVCGQSHDESTSSEKHVTPITVDFSESKRQKLNIVVLDKVPKVSVQAPETPVLRLGNSALPGRPKRRYPKDEDSVSRIGYNGLGGHTHIVMGSGKKKTFRKQI